MDSRFVTLLFLLGTVVCGGSASPLDFSNSTTIAPTSEAEPESSTQSFSTPENSTLSPVTTEDNSTASNDTTPTSNQTTTTTVATEPSDSNTTTNTASPTPTKFKPTPTLPALSTAISTTFGNENCTNFTCSEGEIDCPLTCLCIEGDKICDGIDDCPDGSDEFQCNISSTIAPSTIPYCNNETEFYCAADDICINVTQVDNNIIDCPADCADEANYTSNCPTATEVTPVESNNVTRIIIASFAVAVLLIVAAISASFIFSKKRSGEVNSRFRRLIEDDHTTQNTEGPLYANDQITPELSVQICDVPRVTILDDDDDFEGRVKWERGQEDQEQSVGDKNESNA